MKVITGFRIFSELKYIFCNWVLSNLPKQILNYKLWAEVLPYWSALAHIVNTQDCE